MEALLEKCKTCENYPQFCFCGAPRTQALYKARLQWANIDYPASDNPEKQLDRVLNEPQRWLSFAKEIERENERLRKALEHYIDMTTLAIPDDWNPAKMGGWPDINQLEKRDVGDVARAALGINDVVNERL